MQEQRVDRISLWSQAGPSLLLGAFAVVLFKCAPAFWPLTLTAYLGYGAIRLFAKKGFALSLIALAAVAVLFFRSQEIWWPLVLTFSIALSWMLIFLGGKEKEVFYLGCAETIQDLEKECSTLQEEVRKAKASVSLENKEIIAERERLNLLYSETALKLEQVEKEREKLREKNESLTKDLSASQRKEAAFQHALNDAQGQLLALKNEPTIVPQEEGDVEEKALAEQLQRQYATLREQFEEKSEALDTARKELFRVENELLTLQKVTEESTCEVSDEELVLMNDLLEMEQECQSLEAQVSSLQEFITSLLTPKKRAVRSKKGAKSEDSEDLPEMIQDRIDQTLHTE